MGRNHCFKFCSWILTIPRCKSKDRVFFSQLKCDCTSEPFLKRKRRGYGQWVAVTGTPPPNSFSGVYPRRMCDINPTDLMEQTNVLKPRLCDQEQSTNSFCSFQSVLKMFGIQLHRTHPLCLKTIVEGVGGGGDSRDPEFLIQASSCDYHSP